MSIRSIFTPHPKAESPAYRYGMLIFIVVMFAWQIELYLARPPGYDGDPYSGFVVVLMLLFNHLVSAFKWPKRLTTALWILTWSWLVFGLFYIIYLSRALYPLPPLP